MVRTDASLLLLLLFLQCAHRRRVTCIGTASGQQLNGEEACSDVRPARVSQCTF